jgi:hypothetical protein
MKRFYARRAGLTSFACRKWRGWDRRPVRESSWFGLGIMVGNSCARRWHASAAVRNPGNGLRHPGNLPSRLARNAGQAGNADSNVRNNVRTSGNFVSDIGNLVSEPSGKTRIQWNSLKIRKFGQQRPKGRCGNRRFQMADGRFRTGRNPAPAPFGNQ